MATVDQQNQWLLSAPAGRLRQKTYLYNINKYMFTDQQGMKVSGNQFLFCDRRLVSGPTEKGYQVQSMGFRSSNPDAVFEKFNLTSENMPLLVFIEYSLPLRSRNTTLVLYQVLTDSELGILINQGQGVFYF